MKTRAQLFALLGAPFLLGLQVVFSGCAGGGSALSPPADQPPGYNSAAPNRGAARRGITREDYHGWSNALALRSKPTKTMEQ